MEAGAPEKFLTELDKEAAQSRERLGKEAYDSDDDEGGGGGQRVQCAQQ